MTETVKQLRRNKCGEEKKQSEPESKEERWRKMVEARKKLFQEEEAKEAEKYARIERKRRDYRHEDTGYR